MTIDGMMELSCAVSQGNPGGMAKGANLMPCQRNELYTFKKLPFLFDIRECVSGFITAIQMIRNVFSEQVFYGTVLLSVCTDQIHHTLSWHLEEMTTTM